jgi:hypothetical protein
VPHRIRLEGNSATAADDGVSDGADVSARGSHNSPVVPLPGALSSTNCPPVCASFPCLMGGVQCITREEFLAPSARHGSHSLCHAGVKPRSGATIRWLRPPCRRRKSL